MPEPGEDPQTPDQPVIDLTDADMVQALQRELGAEQRKTLNYSAALANVSRQLEEARNQIVEMAATIAEKDAEIKELKKPKRTNRTKN